MKQKDALETIIKLYDGKLMLTKREISKLVGRSISALDRDIRESKGIAYKKVRGKILYPIHEVAKWISDLDSNIRPAKTSQEDE